MAVMAAGMHDAGVLRFIGMIDDLLDRKRVHVGAQPDRLAAFRFAPLDDAHDARATDPGHDLVDAEFLQLLRHQRRRPVHIELQFGIGVDVATPFGDVLVELCDTIDDRHGLLSLRFAGNRMIDA